MKNFIQLGKSIDIAAPAGGVTSGLVVILGSLIGVSSVTAPEGEMVAIQTEGVYDLPKTSAQAWTVGAKIYWDATNKVATTTATSNTLIGIAVAAAANPSASGWVKLGATTV
jgi:predicted RecA/RadA family phage recombinase